MKTKADGNIRILAVGDVVGRPGRQYLKRALPVLKATWGWDVLVVNVENAAGGFGMTAETYSEFVHMNIHCMTSGNHIYDKKGYQTWMDQAELLIRPANMPQGSVGKSYLLIELPGGKRLAVVNLIARTFMKPYDCPFRAGDRLLKELTNQADIILVDFHGEASSEKIAMGHYLSKRVSAVWGTHTHVPTADARILDQHTGYITDLGMTGSYDSVIGMKKEAIIEGFITLERTRFEVAKDDPRLGGCLFDINPLSGVCEFIQGLFLSEEDLVEIDRKTA